MESHDLWIFKHVAELQSISKAAHQLGYVQPNVSQRIMFLEDELGVKLFLRNNRGVTLTEEGKILLKYTNQMIRLMGEAKSLINPQKWRGSLTIGASQTISAVKIPQLISSFLRKHNNIDVKVRTNDKQRLLEMLSYGELDGVFINDPQNDSTYETVYSFTENIVLISPSHSQIEKQHDQTLIVNSDINCIYRNKMLDFSIKNNFYNPAIMEFDSLESILQAVYAGLGISILPADVAYSRKEIKNVQYHKLDETIKIDFVIQHKKQHPQILKQFMHFLQELV